MVIRIGTRPFGFALWAGATAKHLSPLHQSSRCCTDLSGKQAMNGKQQSRNSPVRLSLPVEWKRLDTVSLCKENKLSAPDHPAIVFDVETASGEFNTSILQLAAVGPCRPYFASESVEESKSAKLARKALAQQRTANLSVFAKYMQPTTPMSYFSSKVHKIYLRRKKGKEELMRHGMVLPAQEAKLVLKDFVNWVLQITGGKPALLVAHNCHQLDMRSLINAFTAAGLTEDFRRAVVGFQDTLPAFSKDLQCSPVSLEAVYDQFIGGKFSAHDAASDVRALAELISCIPLNAPIMDLETAIKFIRYRSDVVRCLKTHQPARKVKALSEGISTRLAEMGVLLSDLHAIHLADPECGLLHYICSPVDSTGNARVTAVKSVARKLVAYFSDRGFQLARCMDAPHWQGYASFEGLIRNGALSNRHAFLLACDGVDVKAFEGTDEAALNVLISHASETNKEFLQSVKNLGTHADTPSNNVTCT